MSHQMVQSILTWLNHWTLPWGTRQCVPSTCCYHKAQETSRPFLIINYILRWVVQHTSACSYLAVQIHQVIHTAVTGTACAWPAPLSNSQPCRTAPYTIMMPCMVLSFTHLIGLRISRKVYINCMSLQGKCYMYLTYMDWFGGVSRSQCHGLQYMT